MRESIDVITARDLNLVRTGRRGGTPVILMHAVGIDLTYWGDAIEALRGEHDIVAFDLPGHGRSPGNASDWSLERAAALLADVVGMTSDGPAHIVGLSVGGMIAQAFAIAYPQLAASLTLVDTAATFGDEGRAAMRARAESARRDGMESVVASTLERWFTEETRRDRPDLVDRVTKTLLADDPQVHAAMWDMISALDLTRDLHRIACPTLMLVGEHDPSSPPASAQLLADNIRGARMHVIADASHLSPLEKPQIVFAHLKAFLTP